MEPARNVPPTCTPVWRHVVAHDSAVATPLGDDGLTGVVGSVYVYIGQVPEKKKESTEESGY